MPSSDVRGTTEAPGPYARKISARRTDRQPVVPCLRAGNAPRALSGQPLPEECQDSDQFSCRAGHCRKMETRESLPLSKIDFATFPTDFPTIAPCSASGQYQHRLTIPKYPARCTRAADSKDEPPAQ